MFKKRTEKYDIIVVGGGHAGLTTTALLAKGGFNVACVDTEDPKTFKQMAGRTTAISYGSAQILKRTGAWDTLLKQSCPIKDIHILDGSRSKLLLEFLSSDIEREAFGWIIDNNIIKIELLNQIKKHKNAAYISKSKVIDFENNEEGATILLENGQSLLTKILIGADGRQSLTRQKLGIETRKWSYNQTAIVCTVHHDNSHKNIAVEHFYTEGPFAILPMNDDKKGNHRSAIVWSEENTNKEQSALNYDEDTFNIALQSRFPDFYGRVSCASKPLSYPLSFSHAADYIGQNIALVADAAHGIHPIAGQGLNIGLRDISVLTTLLIEAKNKGQDWSNQNLLDQYEKMRRFDNMTMSGATDNLNSLFGSHKKSIKLLRKTGLRIIQRVKPAKEFFMRCAMGE